MFAEIVNGSGRHILIIEIVDISEMAQEVQCENRNWLGPSFKKCQYIYIFKIGRKQWVTVMREEGRN